MSTQSIKHPGLEHFQKVKAHRKAVAILTKEILVQNQEAREKDPKIKEITESQARVIAERQIELKAQEVEVERKKEADARKRRDQARRNPPQRKPRKPPVKVVHKQAVVQGK